MRADEDNSGTRQTDGNRIGRKMTQESTVEILDHGRLPGGLHQDLVIESQGAESTLSFPRALGETRSADRADPVKPLGHEDRS